MLDNVAEAFAASVKEPACKDAEAFKLAVAFAASVMLVVSAPEAVKLAVDVAAKLLDPACKSAVAVRLAVAAVASVMLVLSAPEAVRLAAVLDCR